MLASARPAAPSSHPDDADARWFAEEVKRYEPGLRSWLRLGFPVLRDLDDIIQEAYLRLFRARAAGLKAPPRSYLYGIARNVALETCRKNRLFWGVPLNELPESDVVQTVTHNQEVALVVEAMKTLPKQCREVAMLYTQKGLSYRTAFFVGASDVAWC